MMKKRKTQRRGNIGYLENPSSCFTMIYNAINVDKAIPPEARGVYMYIRYLPNGYKITLKGIASDMGCGVAKIRTAMDILEQHGYIERTRQYDEKGHRTADYYRPRHDPKGLLMGKGNPDYDPDTAAFKQYGLTPPPGKAEEEWEEEPW